MTRILTTLFLLATLLSYPMTAQQEFRVVSYNVENLFDTEDDPSKEDHDFLPSGNRRWTPGRYYRKLQQIAKVITATGQWDTPALVGLCEVENDSVLTHLLYRTPLRLQQYRYCMTHGQDTRGINVALLYQRDKFGYLGHTEYPVRFGGKGYKKTRNILHTWGKVITGNILDVFVCHFPSRYGGEKESETARLDAAKTLRELCDSLQQIRPLPQIIIMGDFNDNPEDESISRIIGARSENNKQPHPSLFNLFTGTSRSHPPGSHKFQGEWSQLDQIIISANLADTTATMHLQLESARVFAPHFLLISDKTWRGVRPKRTFHGFRYEAGYSDHLPVIADFLLSLPNQK